MGAHIYILYLSQSAAGNQAYTRHGPLVMYFSGYYLKRKYFCLQVNCFLHLLWSKQHHPRNPHDVAMPPVSDLCLSDFTLGGTNRTHYFFGFHPGRLKVCPCCFSLRFAKGVFLLFCFLNQRMINKYSSTVLLIAEWQRKQQEWHIAIHWSNVKTKRFTISMCIVQIDPPTKIIVLVLRNLVLSLWQPLLFFSVVNIHNSLQARRFEHNSASQLFAYLQNFRQDSVCPQSPQHLLLRRWIQWLQI